MPNVRCEDWTATVPVLRGCLAEGDTIAHALEDISEVIALFLESMQDEGEEIPDGPVDVTVVERDIARARQIYRECAEEEGIAPPYPEPKLATVVVQLPLAAASA